MDAKSHSGAFFIDRIDAGRWLGKLLHNSYGNEKVVVYALPRGGVVVGAEVAKILNAPLDLIITVKIANPYSPENAIGAVAKDQHSVLSDEILTVDPLWIAQETEKAIEEALTRHIIYQRAVDNLKFKADKKKSSDNLW